MPKMGKPEVPGWYWVKTLSRRPHNGRDYRKGVPMYFWLGHDHYTKEKVWKGQLGSTIGFDERYSTWKDWDIYGPIDIESTKPKDWK